MTELPSPDLTEVIDARYIPTIGNADGQSIVQGVPAGEVTLNLGDGDHFSLAVQVVEDQILDAFTIANELDVAGQTGEAILAVERILEYITTVPPKVMAGVLMSMGDLSARAFMRLRELESEHP